MTTVLKGYYINMNEPHKYPILCAQKRRVLTDNDEENIKTPETILYHCCAHIDNTRDNSQEQ